MTFGHLPPFLLLICYWFSLKIIILTGRLCPATGQASYGYDAKAEAYSLAVKRLNQQDNMQIVVEQNLVTDKFLLNVPDHARDEFLGYVDFTNTKNKEDKVRLYQEWFDRTYLLKHRQAYGKVDMVLEGNFWYDADRTARIMKKYAELVTARESLKKSVTNAERMKVNKTIKQAIAALDVEEF